MKSNELYKIIKGSTQEDFKKVFTRGLVTDECINQVRLHIYNDFKKKKGGK